MKVPRRMQIAIPGEPIGKGRPRFVRATGRTFTPEKTSRYESLVRLAFAEKYPDHRPIDSKIELFIRAYFPIPESWPKYRKANASSGIEKKTSKPDLDNIIKSICDGLNGVAWTDDSRIWRLEASKEYSNRPEVLVTIDYCEEKEEPHGGDQ